MEDWANLTNSNIEKFVDENLESEKSGSDDESD
jgi:hypothetical protein